jgi:TatD DNase family protein
MMQLLDIHTHRVYVEPKQAIRNLFPEQLTECSDGYYSVGIHPWHIQVEKVENQWKDLEIMAQNTQVLAIGETGLDRLCKTSYILQLKLFQRHIVLAELLHIPLIIHSVHAVAEVIQLKRKYHSTIPWVIHGFRGKKELAQQLVSSGFFLSFGEQYQEDALNKVPLNSLFIETDESEIDIHQLYKRAADVRRMPVNEFTAAIQENIQKVFLKY